MFSLCFLICQVTCGNYLLYRKVTRCMYMYVKWFDVIRSYPFLPVCKPDLKLNFDNGIRDISGNNYRVVARRVRLYNGAAYFRGNSKLLVEPFRPKTDDDGTFIVKLRYREDLRRRNMWGLQSVVTNGHCGQDASIVVTKVPGKVFVGAESTNMTKYYYLPTTVSIQRCLNIVTANITFSEFGQDLKTELNQRKC